MDQDFTKYYWLEEYLLDEVGPRFRRDGSLTAHDFFFIIKWKSARALPKIVAGLQKPGASIDDGIRELANQLHKESTLSAKLGSLVKRRGFGLAMASALLAVLYPDDFTVYDWRVCEQVDLSAITWRDTDDLWEKYSAYCSRVANAPIGSTLREKDRYYWGKSYYEDVEGDLNKLRTLDSES